MRDHFSIFRLILTKTLIVFTLIKVMAHMSFFLDEKLIKKKITQKCFDTNSNFLIHISLQPNGVNLSLFDQQNSQPIISKVDGIVLEKNSFGEIFLSFIFFFFAFEKSNYSFPSLIISLQLSRSSSYSLVILYISIVDPPPLIFLPWSERGNRLVQYHDFYQVSKFQR